MKIHIDTEDRSFVEKFAQGITEPVLYIFPRYQKDCFGLHEVYRFKILEKQALIQENDVFQSDENDFPIPIFQDRKPIFAYPNLIELGTQWKNQGKKLYIRKIHP